MTVRRPLVNLGGQVIGINTAVAGQAQNIGFAIPINDVKSLIASVQSSGKISHPYLGVRYVQITKDFATRNNLKVTDGAYVIGDQEKLAVLPDSPAAKAGIQSGDIITRVDGQALDVSHTLPSVLGRRQVGDHAKLEIVRGSDTKQVEVVLAEAPVQAGQ